MIDVSDFEGTPYEGIVDSEGFLRYGYDECGEEDQVEYLHWLQVDLDELGYRIVKHIRTSTEISARIEKIV